MVFKWIDDGGATQVGRYRNEFLDSCILQFPMTILQVLKLGQWPKFAVLGHDNDLKKSCITFTNGRGSLPLGSITNSYEVESVVLYTPRQKHVIGDDPEIVNCKLQRFQISDSIIPAY